MKNFLKTIVNIVSVLLILAGTVFFLQGINVLPGSYMTGDIRWAINGGIAILVGIIVLVLVNRRKSPTS